MTLNVKALGLTAVAVLAISAVVASTAHAQTELTASEYPAILTGELLKTEEHPEHIISIGTFGSLKCEGAKLTGTTKMADDHTEQTFTPSFSDCFFKGLPATVTMNSCDFLIKFAGTLDIVCPTDPKHILIDVWFSMQEHPDKETTCKFTIGPQTGLKGVGFTVTNVAGQKTDFDVTFGVANIAIKRIQGTSGNCGAENPVGGANYSGMTTMRAYEDNNGNEGNQLNLTV